MKKIEKVNNASAQSVYSFACPCNGSCSVACFCTTPHSTSANSLNSLKSNNPNVTTLV
ncbi:MAG: hypothetical protein K0S61_2672 [Anaerocolumna sp.]|jgi:putative bacteriocin precursor|nr:hypothetical protein [Anaerocolumna sp.]